MVRMINHGKKLRPVAQLVPLLVGLSLVLSLSSPRVVENGLLLSTSQGFFDKIRFSITGSSMLSRIDELDLDSFIKLLGFS